MKTPDDIFQCLLHGFVPLLVEGLHKTRTRKYGEFCAFGQYFENGKKGIEPVCAVKPVIFQYN
jgi:hypothetical protein